MRNRGDSSGEKRNTLEVDHVFSNESKITFQFDFFEIGLGGSGGTWDSVSQSSVNALRKVTREQRGAPARIRCASATALPMRDQSVNVVITDPPYYDMIEYADASDLFHVWLKRILFDIEPDLFGPDCQQPDGLQRQEPRKSSCGECMSRIVSDTTRRSTRRCSQSHSMRRGECLNRTAI